MADGLSDFADLIADSRWEALPEDVQRHTVRTFVNFLGCAIGGGQHDAVERAEQALLLQGTTGRAFVVGRGAGYPPAVAALLNGVAGAVNAFDDTHAQATIHAGPPVGAALLSLIGVLDTPVRGADFLAAYAWGLELAFRLSKAVSVAPANGDLGWSQTGIAAPVGAAAACGRLLGLSPKQILWAIGIAASLACGQRAAHGTMAMHLAPGRASAAGLEAALLARAGFTGPEAGIDGKMGYLALFAKEAAPEYLTDGLGERFELLANMFKPYPCGIVFHAVIDACLALSTTQGLSADFVESLIVEVPEIAIRLADNPQPDGVFAAQVSIQHWAAAALLRGKAGLEEGSLAAVLDPQIVVLREKCRLVSRADLGSDAAVVTLRFDGGRSRSVEITHGIGSLANPIGDAGIAGKFLEQASRLLGDEAAKALLAQCWAIPDSDNIEQIVSALAGDVERKKQ